MRSKTQKILFFFAIFVVTACRSGNSKEANLHSTPESMTTDARNRNECRRIYDLLISHKGKKEQNSDKRNAGQALSTLCSELKYTDTCYRGTAFPQGNGLEKMIFKCRDPRNLEEHSIVRCSTGCVNVDPVNGFPQHDKCYTAPPDSPDRDITCDPDELFNE